MKTEPHIALLRGVNVGGKNILPMKDLATIFSRAGCQDVVTYIQSGNVVFSCDKAAPAHLRDVIQDAIQKRFGFSAPVVMRAATEVRRIATDNPFLRTGAAPEALHVAFLSSAPSASRVAGLDAQRSPPDELVVRGREIFLHLPGGVGKSKLTNAYFDRALETTSTVRNWRTVLKLVELSER